MVLSVVPLLHPFVVSDICFIIISFQLYESCEVAAGENPIFSDFAASKEKHWSFVGSYFLILQGETQQ